MLNHIHLSSIFLLLQCVLTLRYLWFKEEYFRPSRLPSARAFGITVVAVMFSTTVFTWFLGADYFLMALALSLGITLSTFRPVAALGFFTSVLFLRPWEYAEQGSLLFLLTKVLAVLSLLSWLFHSFRSHTLTLRWNRTVQLFVLLLVWLTMSCAFSPTPAE
ncbi:MAG: hypothetical protein KDD55_09700, partial [Bdellovibrionales bacterium]|nr:hypothetical protein [Bdellovibrionales bacterium]